MKLFTRDSLLKDLSSPATDTGIAIDIKTLKAVHSYLRENILNAFVIIKYGSTQIVGITMKNYGFQNFLHF